MPLEAVKFKGTDETPAEDVEYTAVGEEELAGSSVLVALTRVVLARLVAVGPPKLVEFDREYGTGPDPPARVEEGYSDEDSKDVVPTGNWEEVVERDQEPENPVDVTVPGTVELHDDDRGIMPGPLSVVVDSGAELKLELVKKGVTVGGDDGPEVDGETVPFMEVPLMVIIEDSPLEIEL